MEVKKKRNPIIGSMIYVTAFTPEELLLLLLLKNTIITISDATILIPALGIGNNTKVGTKSGAPSDITKGFGGPCLSAAEFGASKTRRRTDFCHFWQFTVRLGTCFAVRKHNQSALSILHFAEHLNVINDS